MSKKAHGVFPGMLLLALILIFKGNVTHICGTYRGAVLSFSEFTGVKEYIWKLQGIIYKSTSSIPHSTPLSLILFPGDTINFYTNMNCNKND